MSGNKNDQGKNRLDLIPAEVIDALGRVLTYGCKKYGPNNWREGIAYSRVYGAVLRHLNAWRFGAMDDAESGLPHLHHALCELAFLVTYEAESRAGVLDDVHSHVSEFKEDEIIIGQYDHECDMVQGDNGDWYNLQTLKNICKDSKCPDCPVQILCSMGRFEDKFNG